jgi:hypothetical protein
MEKKHFDTYEEFSDFVDKFVDQQMFLYNLDEQVNKLVTNDGWTYEQAFDKVYSISVLKKLGFLPESFEEPDEYITFEDLSNSYTPMVEKQDAIDITPEGE